MSIPQYFDAHTHVHFAAYADDSDEVIRRALEAGVWMVNVGTQRDTSGGAVATAEKYPEGVYAAIGLHPIHTEKSHHDSAELGSSDESKGFTSRGEDFDYDFYKQLALHPKVVAIGECGLDYYRLGEETKGRQFEAFDKQIALAAEVAKPLMIHCRNAFPDLIAILKSKIINLKSQTPGLIHFFTGTVADAGRLLDLGFSFSFGGVTTFTSDYDEVLRYIPLDHILSETDAPYVTPVPYRGKRNEPLYVREVVKRIALIRGEDSAGVQKALVGNARRMFGV